jgi:hypothetical protein
LVAAAGDDGWSIIVLRPRALWTPSYPSPEVRENFREYKLQRVNLRIDQKNKVREFLVSAGARLTLSVAEFERRLDELPVLLVQGLTRESAQSLSAAFGEIKVPVKVLPPEKQRQPSDLVLHEQSQVFEPDRSGFALLCSAATGALGVGAAFVGSLLLPSLAGDMLSAAMILAGCGSALGGGLVSARVLNRRPRLSRRILANAPLAQIDAATSSLAVMQALPEHTRIAMQAVRSPRLKSLARRILGRAMAVKQRLAAEAALPDEPRQRLDQLVDAALQTAQRAGALDAELAVLDLTALHEQVQVLDERIAAATEADAAEPLIAEKLRLKDRLADIDAKQDELALLFGRLLDVASRLAAFEASLSASAPGKADSVSLSVILRELELELAAHAEVEPK